MRHEQNKKRHTTAAAAHNTESNNKRRNTLAHSRPSALHLQITLFPLIIDASYAHANTCTAICQKCRTLRPNPSMQSISPSVGHFTIAHNPDINAILALFAHSMNTSNDGSDGCIDTRQEQNGKTICQCRIAGWMKWARNCIALHRTNETTPHRHDEVTLLKLQWHTNLLNRIWFVVSRAPTPHSIHIYVRHTSCNNQCCLVGRLELSMWKPTQSGFKLNQDACPTRHRRTINALQCHALARRWRKIPCNKWQKSRKFHEFNANSYRQFTIH